MKKFILTLSMIVLSCHIHAQTWEEWTKQKKTQIKYLLEQIISLGAYGKQLKAGYDIVQQGLSTIHNIKQGDFYFHDDFFSSLKRVNPNISKYTKVPAIILLQADIIRQSKQAIKSARENDLLNQDELKYLIQVYNYVLKLCITLLDDLSNVITNDQLQLSDDERVKRIDVLYSEMQEYYVFAKSFKKDINVLAIQRARNQKDIHHGRKLYGLD